MLPILFGVSIVVFLTLKMIPGDPVAAMLGIDAPASAREQLTHQLGLDQALPVQYWKWITRVLHGDFGTSIMRQVPVSSVLFPAFENTLILAVAALLIAVVAGMTLGGLAAAFRGRLSGKAASLLAVLALSMPEYTMGLILLVIFAVDLQVFPSGGIHSSVGSAGFLDLLNHLVLPAISASLIPTGIIARMFRSSLIDITGAEFVEGMRARGLSAFSIARHAAHNTLPSLLTVTGLQVGYLLGGIVFVETIFSWPGMGLLLFNAISARDYPIIQAGVLVAASSFVLINALVDSFHAYVDPRIR